MKKQIKTKGIILRRVNLNEADQILTVLTPTEGKIHCVAKGSRRMTSKFCGRLELLYEVDFNLHKGRNLESLREAELTDVQSFFDLSLEQHGVLFYLAEITDKFVMDHQHVDGLYDLLQSSLHHLHSDNQSEVVLHAYLVKLFTLMGFMPSWDHCARSDERLDANYPLYFSALDAGVISHPLAQPGDIRIPAPMVKWVNFMQKYPFAAIAKVKTTPGERLQVWTMIRTILPNILTTPIKAEKFFEATNL